jgi:sugar phosphate isomerase/epimerase
MNARIAENRFLIWRRWKKSNRQGDRPDKPKSEGEKLPDVKLTLSTLTCPDWPLEQIIAVAAQNGIRGIDFRGIGSEIDITRLTDFTAHLDRTLASLRAASLQMPCVNTSVTLCAPSAQRWEAMLEECQRYARLAAASGTPFLRVFGGNAPNELDHQETVRMAHRRLRQIVKICQVHQCKPIVETHDDWCTAPEILELIDGLDSAEVGVLWDIEHSFRKGEEPHLTPRRLGKFLAHVHVKDSVRMDGRSKPMLLGQGELPVRQCVAALQEIGYDGWYSLETEKRWHADAPDPAESIPQFAAFMRGLTQK